MKKQDEEAETVEQCIARLKAADPNLTDEAARAKCTPKPSETESATEEQKGFIGKLTAVFEEAMEKKLDTFMKRIDDRMNQIAKQKEDEAVEALRKGLGISKDPVVHLSEIEGMVRKIMLEEKPHGKRTETLTKEKPTEGTEPEKKIDSAADIHKRLTEKRGMNF